MPNHCKGPGSSQLSNHNAKGGMTELKTVQRLIKMYVVLDDFHLTKYQKNVLQNNRNSVRNVAKEINSSCQ